VAKASRRPPFRYLGAPPPGSSLPPIVFLKVSGQPAVVHRLRQCQTHAPLVRVNRRDNLSHQPRERLSVRVAVARVALRQCLRLCRVRLSLSVTPLHLCVHAIHLDSSRVNPKVKKKNANFKNTINRTRDTCLPDSNPYGRDGLAHSRSLSTARRALRVAEVGVSSFMNQFIQNTISVLCGGERAIDCARPSRP